MLPQLRPPPSLPPPYLDDDLIIEILSWLSVKFLMQLRCVCKSWKSLIFHPQFAKLQLQRSSAQNIRLMFEHTDDGLGDFVSSCSVSSLILEKFSSNLVETSPHYLPPVNKKSLLSKLRPIGTCNGLITLLKVTYDVLEKKNCCQVIFWNPTMNLSQESPHLYIEKPLYKKEEKTFDFGFGYDCLSDTYKVVAVSREEKVNVYNMGGNCWRNVSAPVVPRTNLEKDGVYLNGTLNWIEFEFNGIVSFDLGKEKWAKLSFPCRPDPLDDRTTLGILRDCLCVNYDNGVNSFVIWQMKKFGVHESWTQILKFDRSPFDSPWYLYICTLVPLFMSENDDFLLLSKPGLDCEKVLFVYNDRDKRLEQKYKYDIKDAMLYKETLISPC